MRSLIAGMRVEHEGDTYYWYPQTYAEKQDATAIAQLPGTFLEEKRITLTLPTQREARRMLHLNFRLKHEYNKAVPILFMATAGNNIKKIVVYF